jgi:Glycosyltransferase family 87
LIKLYPGLLGLYFLRCGPRRVAWWGMVMGIAIVIASLGIHGIAPYQEYIRKVLLGGYYPYAAEFNISLVGFFQRLLVPSRFAIAVADLPGLAWGLAAFFSILLLLGCWHSGNVEVNQAVSLVRYSAYLCAMLLIAPVNGAYNLVLLLLPAVAGIRALELQPSTGLGTWLILGLALACVPPGWSAGLPVYEMLHTGWGILLLSPAVYGVGIVFVVMVVMSGKWQVMSNE